MLDATAHPNRYGSIVSDAKRLDQSCRKYLGVTSLMWRTAMFLFHISVLIFTVYLIESGSAEPMVAVGVAVTLIAGPEGFETWLIHKGVIDSTDDGAD